MARRWLLFALSLASLVLLTYAGVLFSFSIPVTEEIATMDPDAPGASRAIVVPLGRDEVRTRGPNETGALLAIGDADGSFPASATNVRFAWAVEAVPETPEGREAGWNVQSAADAEPYFAGRTEVLGEVARYEPTARLASLLAMGTVGFVAPLVAVVMTHRGGKRPGAPAIVCRECHAPLVGSAEFCMRCGAWSQKPEEAPRDA